MFADQLSTAATTAGTISAVDNLARLTWRGLAEGHLTEAAADHISASLEVRRQALRVKTTTPRYPKALRAPQRAPQRSPDREKTIQRRRSLAASGVVPARLAGPFTTAQLAVLTVIGREVQKSGTCRLPNDAIAALAGTCRTTVQTTLRLASGAGLLVVRERRRPGLPSLPNVVLSGSREWSTWLLRGRAQNATHHVRDDNKIPPQEPSEDHRSLHGMPQGNVGYSHQNLPAGSLTPRGSLPMKTCPQTEG
jgi:hypothetical protein